MRVKKGETTRHLYLRLFLRAYSQGELGLVGNEYSRKELVEKFAEWGYSYKTGDFTPAKNAKLYLNIIPRTINSKEVAKKLLHILPSFDADSLFSN